MSISKALTIVVPLYNECKAIRYFVQESQKYKDYISELLFIDDGSSDGSLLCLKNELAWLNVNARIISLLNNIGKDKAILVGIKYASGDLIAVMDIDLQCSFEDVMRMTATLSEGNFDIVIAKRNNYNSFWNYIFKLVSHVSFSKDFSNDVSDFIVVKSSVIKDPSARYLESPVFSLKGIILDLSPNMRFENIGIKERIHGCSKMTFSKLLDIFTSTFLLSFPNLLRISFLWSIIFLLFAIAHSLRTIYLKIYYNPPEGFPTLLIVQLVGFSFLFLLIGIMSEYINAIVKHLIVKKPFISIKEIFEYKKNDGN